MNLIKHYKNAIWFHGHSHALFESQELESYSNYSEMNGYKSIHIPSITKAKKINNGEAAEVIEGSQGYEMDVYKDCIVLKGRDFVEAKYLPIAIYQIDTPLHSIIANSFTDDSGLIVTGDYAKVTYNLINIRLNNVTARVKIGATYKATLVATVGNIKDVTVYMDGSGVANTVYNDGEINIPTVTGDIIISARAAADVVDTTLTWSVGTRIDSSNGAEAQNSAYAASNYIKIVNGYNYTLTRTEIAYDAKVCYYDEPQNFMSCTSNNLVSMNAKETSAVIPIITGAAYFRLRCYASGTTVSLEESTASTTITASI